MRKVALYSYDGPAGLRISRVPTPEPGPGEVLVRTEAAGVTLPVLKVLRGHGSAPLPYEPGGDLVGRVRAIGPGVTTLRVGDRVGGLAFSGAYADVVVAPAELLAPVPEGVSAADAVALVRSGLVALAALSVGGLRLGESVVVTAAAGGVGHLAVQLARAMGAGRVVAAVGSLEKAEFVRRLGADEVVVYGDLGDVPAVDLVMEGVGGPTAQSAQDALVPFGRLVVLSGAGGTLDAGALLRGGHVALGLSMAQLVRHRPDAVERWRHELWGHLAAGRLRPSCTAVPLDRAADAVALLESRRNLGKVLLTP
ncbi:zinc-binding alcohol dehydrogenase family protein [Kitasatospora sp. NPDC059571]|uniref:quinone oxidoreductase family protein n=1 Tax=Kitasatospora sp. NPDC059571 TaxID=3346871 RepID=UPI0036BB7C8F